MNAKTNPKFAYLTLSFLITTLFSLNVNADLIEAEKIKIDYYSAIKNFDKLTGYQLKRELTKQITKTHKLGNGYKGLWRAYQKSDLDTTYDHDKSLMDIYSENPNHNDPYQYQIVKQQCGTYRQEGDCYNREHLFPQSIFRKAEPMRSDIYHVFPTDGYVNNKRGRYPFGEVNPKGVKWTSRNKSRLGSSMTPGYNGTVFEPIDEFKGDVARGMLYFAVRYANRVRNYRWGNALNGTSDQVYSGWFIKLLIKWHKNDPVSDHEKKRNAEGFKYQKNRNPFIDYPELVSKIWDHENIQVSQHTQRDQRNQRHQNLQQ
jgi:endonuclease I